MPRKIMIGYDGSDGGRDAVALGAALAKPLATELAVCVVLPQPRHPIGEESAAALQAQGEQLLAEADELLGEQAAEMVTARGHSPARGLHDAAERQGASMVVLGSSHRRGLGRVLIGGVGEAFVSGAPCAVAIAPSGWAQGERRLSRVGAAINGSEDSWPALHAAAELAGRVGGTLMLLAAVEPMSYGYTAAILGALSGEDPDAMAGSEMERLLERAANGVPTGLPVERRLLIGDPGGALVEAAEDLDLLVAGSRGYGPLRRVLLGGVSGRLIRSAPCPLLVLPRGAGSEPFG